MILVCGIYALDTAPPAEAKQTADKHRCTVMIVGGSMAHGWKDPSNNSYIRRAFTSLSNTTSTEFTLVDHSAPGGMPSKVSGKDQFQAWLKRDRPDIVVISWGFLNDASHHTSVSEIRREVDREIELSLQSRALVVLVTPPVVLATAVDYQRVVQKYIAAEQESVAYAHSPNVYFFNLNRDMAAYLSAHHQSVASYNAPLDRWHPNQAGHELAGTLLAANLAEIFTSQSQDD